MKIQNYTKMGKEVQFIEIKYLIKWLDDNFRNQDGTKLIIETIKKESSLNSEVHEKNEPQSNPKDIKSKR